MSRTGVEPARANAHYPLKVARLPIPPPGHERLNESAAILTVLSAFARTKTKNVFALSNYKYLDANTDLNNFDLNDKKYTTYTFSEIC